MYKMMTGKYDFLLHPLDIIKCDKIIRNKYIFKTENDKFSEADSQKNLESTMKCKKFFR